VDEVFKDAQILIVDDQEANVLALTLLLKEAGYTKLVGTTDSRQFFPVFLDCRPDIVLLDLHMPHVDGFSVLERLRLIAAGETYLPVLVLTADATRETKRRALGLGAKDFLTKPFDAIEVLLRIHNMLEARFLHLQLRQQNLTLEDRVRARTQELQEAHIQTLRRLAKAAEYRDDATGKHAERVGELAKRIAAALHWPKPDVELIRMAAPLHDIGKIGIPDSILLRPEQLTVEEMRVMQTHTTIGASILSGSEVPLLRLAEEIALAHHERWDGKGYPRGLAGEGAPAAGRLVAVADAYDALTSDRVYRAALPRERALEVLRKGAGEQWDPTITAALLDDSFTAEDTASSFDEMGTVPPARSGPGDRATLLS
jgi:putative two-component system response regulator